MSYIAIVTLLVTTPDAGFSAFIIPTTIGATTIANRRHALLSRRPDGTT